MKSLRDLLNRLPADGNVRHLLRSFNFGMGGTGKVPSVQNLASQLGFDVYLVGMSKGERGRLVCDPFSGSGYRIEVNANDDVQTRRWTVLHEIMHFYLHPRPDVFAEKHRATGSYFYDSTELSQEREANRAVEVLVFGDGALEAALTLYGDDRSALAKHFGVSLKTLQIAMQRFP